MRILGLMAVMTACVGLSLVVLGGKRRQLLTLYGLERSAALMRAELSTRLCPIPELIRLAGRETDGEAAAFFQTLYDELEHLGEIEFTALWIKAARLALPSLDAPVRARWERLGGILGRYELEEQLTAIDGVLREINQELSRQRDGDADRRRVTLALGAAAGAFLCLLMY